MPRSSGRVLPSPLSPLTDSACVRAPRPTVLTWPRLQRRSCSRCCARQRVSRPPSLGAAGRPPPGAGPGWAPGPPPPAPLPSIPAGSLRRSTRVLQGGDPQALTAGKLRLVDGVKRVVLLVGKGRTGAACGALSCRQSSQNPIESLTHSSLSSLASRLLSSIHHLIHPSIPLCIHP